MTDLTKEEFASHTEATTKRFDAVDQRLDSVRNELRQHADEQTERLARIVADAFTEQNKYLEARFDNLEKDLDLRSTVLTLERRLAKLEQQRP